MPEIKQELKDKRYSLILFFMAIVTALGLKKFYNQISIKIFSIYIAIGSLFGWTWHLFVIYLDPLHSGWWYEPHKILGSVGLVAYEDIVFYPICGALFYFVRQVMPSVECKIDKALLKLMTFGTFIYLGIASFVFFKIGGISSTLWFLIPGLIMYLYTWKNIDIIKFLLTGAFIITMASVWDLWIKDWIYITADLKQSNIWISYYQHPYAWINSSPIEITPWFSICGWIFIYSLAQSCEKFFSPKK